MKRTDWTKTLALGLLIGCAGVAGVPAALAAEAEAPTKWTPRLALDVKRVSNVRVSPDGSRALFEAGAALMDDETSQWRTHIHLANLETGESFQLTQGEKSASGARWSPDGEWIAFTSSREGEHADIYRIRVAGGEAERLTELKGGAGSLAWSPDGSRIAFTMADPPTDEEQKDKKAKRDAIVVDEDHKMARLRMIPVEADENGERPVATLTEGDFSVGGGFDWSPDGRRIVFAHVPTPEVNDWTRADVSIVDVETKSVWPLAATGAAESDPHFSPDGSRIALTITDDPPRWARSARVHLIDARGGSPAPLAETHDGQPNILGFSADGERVFVTETRGTVGAIGALPVDGGDFAFLTPGRTHVSGASLSASGKHFGFTIESPASAPEPYFSPSGRFDAAPIASVQELPELPIGRTETLRWSSTDGMEIEGLLTYPAGYEPGERAPLLVVIHGGPAGVFTQSFIGNRGAYPLAAFAAEGFAILRVNPRGSSGYGVDFRRANHADWGGLDYHDIMTGVDHVIDMGVADGGRMGVMGWSYGGFMTSWVITQTDRFKAASVGAGVTNLMSMTGVTDITDFIPDAFGGSPWEVIDEYEESSAMFHIENARTPTLIQHGQNDRRVPIAQGYELYDALKRLNVPTKMVVYPRQGHGVGEPWLQLDAMERNLDWFNRWVKGEEGED